MKSIHTDPPNHAAEGDERIRTAVCAPGADYAYGIPAGTRVLIVGGDRSPSINTWVGEEGVTERPEDGGCYVRFPNRSYVFVWWDEIARAEADRG